MLILKTIGWITGVSGILFLFAPKMILRASEIVNKILIDLDRVIYKLRVGIGISLCLVSFMVFFIAYYLSFKYGLR